MVHTIVNAWNRASSYADLVLVAKLMRMTAPNHKYKIAVE
jgi:hypothetical protein